MKKNKIVVRSIEYEFFYDENLNMWRTLENSYFLEGHSIDMEIELSNFSEGSMDWQRVEKFIEFLHNNNSIFLERIADSKIVLQSFFATINKKAYDEDFLKHIEFKLTGINYKGNCKIVNLEGQFEFDYFFFPQYTKDPYRDIGSFVWRANFRETLLLGVYCDRI